MNIHHLRDTVGQEIVDYNQLKSALVRYTHPRGKISKWLASGDLVRVKKGLYVFGPSASREPYSIIRLANLIYGPSAISLNYALGFYGLIPETVHTVTSITNKRNKKFTTPIGTFTYRYLAKEKYTVGIQLLNSSSGHFLIATPEKALCDIIALKCKNINFNSIDAMRHFLLDDLRIDETALAEMNMKLFDDIVKVYNVKRLNDFWHYFKKEMI